MFLHRHGKGFNIYSKEVLRSIFCVSLPTEDPGDLQQHHQMAAMSTTARIIRSRHGRYHPLAVHIVSVLDLSSCLHTTIFERHRVQCPRC
jgi:hypothetical protein